MTVRVCLVCSGNICRSPTAEVVLRAQAEAAGRGDVVVDSAGTGAWHAGEDIDRRAAATLRAAGYAVARHRARQVTVRDFADHELLVALDRGHLRELHDLAERAADPAAARDKIVLLRSYDPSAGEDLDVPDPYYGGPAGFSEVLGQIERASAGLLATL